MYVLKNSAEKMYIHFCCFLVCVTKVKAWHSQVIKLSYITSYSFFFFFNSKS